MYRSKIFLLLLSFCVLTTFTSRAQNSPAYEENYNEEEEKEEQQSYTYQPTYEEEEEERYEEREEYYEEEEERYEEREEYYEEEEEQQEEYYEEEQQPTYTYSGPPPYEEEYAEEYEEYQSEEYNYDQGGYAGNNTYTYAANTSTGYGQNEGYSGRYNSNSGNIPKFPTSLLTGFVVDIHFLAVDIRFQYIAYHYCSDLYPGFTQCAIYNGTDSNSRLVATEQIVSADIFATLPLAERKLYHSHAFAVKNGLLVLPGVPADQELEAMASVINTYGKVVDYWHSYQDFPLGPPRLAYGLAADNQINLTIIREMDTALNLGTTWLERRKQRESLQMPTIIEGADDYLTSGRFPQYVIREFDLPSNSSR